MNYPVPGNELERLQNLEDLKILDTARQPDFDALVKLAQDLFQVPISAVSLIDRDRQWFKAIAGLRENETPREIAFCNYTIATGEAFFVPDASTDSRFRDNPLVKSDPHLRFYAGVPLALDAGLNIGSLCILDTKARIFDAETRKRLGLLGDIAVSLLRQHRFAKEIADLYQESRRQTSLISEQSQSLIDQKRILDSASAIAKLGAWERNLKTGELEWSDGMFALHEMERISSVPIEQHLELYPEPDRSRLIGLMEEAARESKSFVFEGPMYTAKRNLRWVRLVSNVETKDGRDVRRFGLKQDITEEKAMADWIRRLADTDDLTGLFNRRVLRDRLAGLGTATDRSRDGVSLLILDLDGFKEINDTHGHGAGDACLKRIARRLHAQLGKNCLLARVGGDEFGVLRYGAPKREWLERMADRIIKAIAVPIRWRGQAFQLSASIGIATRAERTEHDAEDMLREADLALYDAKNSGRGCYRSFQPALAALVNKKFETIRDVRKALALNQLELYYQPKVRLADRQHGGFEALLRINKADGSVLAPGSFAAALDDPMLSKEIGDFVTKAALDQAEAWMRARVPFSSIAINLSSSQFRDDEFAEQLLFAIRSRSLHPDMIQVEVTEGIFLSMSSDKVLPACRTLKDGGVRIAFDDFGTGFASLTHLRDFPVDIIKIDRSFISDLVGAGNATAIVNAMVVLGSNLSMQVVAEGVETPDQAEFLRAIGCGMAQGYLFARPMRAMAAAAYLADADIRSLQNSGKGRSRANEGRRIPG